MRAQVCVKIQMCGQRYRCVKYGCELQVCENTGVKAQVCVRVHVCEETVMCKVLSVKIHVCDTYVRIQVCA